MLYLVYNSPVYVASKSLEGIFCYCCAYGCVVLALVYVNLIKQLCYAPFRSSNIRLGFPIGVR